jgi:hypothetical protein
VTAPIAVKVTRYACPFCARSRAKKTATEAHIGRCWFNPENRTCKTCAHFEDAETYEPCYPGRPCSCQHAPPRCNADVDLPEWERTPVAGCPLWQSAEAGERS